MIVYLNASPCPLYYCYHLFYFYVLTPQNTVITYASVNYILEWLKIIEFYIYFFHFYRYVYFCHFYRLFLCIDPVFDWYDIPCAWRISLTFLLALAFWWWILLVFVHLWKTLFSPSNLKDILGLSIEFWVDRFFFPY